MAEWWWPLLAAPFIGSFVGVLIRRLPAGRPVVVARSECESCGRVLRWWEMVPLASYMLLGGRCAGCGAEFGPFHWRVEAAAVAVAGVVVGCHAWWGEYGLEVWADCGLGWTLLALGWIDARHGVLPDALTLPLVLAGLAATWWLGTGWLGTGWLGTGWLEPGDLMDHAVGAAVGWAAFRLVAWAYRAWRGREGLGAGDAKLLAAAGAWVGWQGLDLVVLLGALLSIGVAVWRGRSGGLTGTLSVPFGPGLAVAILAVRLLG